MDYAPPIGQEAQGEAAIYIDGNPEAGIEGSAVPSKAIEPGMRELVHLIRFVGLTPSDTDLEQVRKAITMLIESAAPRMDPIGGIRFFEDEAPRAGYVPCLGTVISNFSRTYPEMAAYLSTSYGAARLVTLAQYNALHTATWATLADGSKIGWEGIGGVTKFVWDKSADTLKMPDLQEMFRSATGASLGVGGAQGDGERNKTGSVAFFAREASPTGTYAQVSEVTGIFAMGETGPTSVTPFNTGLSWTGALRAKFATSRVAPTSAKNQPRAWGALACAYLGQPTS